MHQTREKIKGKLKKIHTCTIIEKRVRADVKEYTEKKGMRCCTMRKLMTNLKKDTTIYTPITSLKKENARYI